MRFSLSVLQYWRMVNSGFHLLHIVDYRIENASGGATYIRSSNRCIHRCRDICSLPRPLQETTVGKYTTDHIKGTGIPNLEVNVAHHC